MAGAAFMTERIRIDSSSIVPHPDAKLACVPHGPRLVRVLIDVERRVQAGRTSAAHQENAWRGNGWTFSGPLFPGAHDGPVPFQFATDAVRELHPIG